MFYIYFVNFIKILLFVFLRICETNISLPDDVNLGIALFQSFRGTQRETFTIGVEHRFYVISVFLCD